MLKLISKTAMLVIAVMLGCAACGSSPTTSSSISGAGSSFIYPVMTRWVDGYHQAKQIDINYQPIGSGGGIAQLKNKTIAFAASDMPLSSHKLQQAGWMQFPAVMGGIVLVVHLPGIHNNQLLLNSKLLADIYQAKIKYWNNPRIRRLNPHLRLPKQPIIPVARADSSGTTFNFTYYLTQTNLSWKKNIGAATNVKWPTAVLGAKGNAGVASQVRVTPGSIGYVEYAYAHQTHLTMTRMQNATGHAVRAELDSFKAAARNANWRSAANRDFNMLLSNQPGKASWPIMATTYVLLPLHNGAPGLQQRNKRIQRFFMWVFTNPTAIAQAKNLQYVSLPKSLIRFIRRQFIHHAHR